MVIQNFKKMRIMLVVFWIDPFLVLKRGYCYNKHTYDIVRMT